MPDSADRAALGSASCGVPSPGSERPETANAQ